VSGVTANVRRVIRRDVVLIIMFVGLALLCFHRRGVTGIDRILLGRYTPVPSSTTFRIANAVTLLGSPVIVIVLGLAGAAVLLFRSHAKAWAAAFLVAPGMAGVTEVTLKVVLARPRPITASLTGEDGNGFPSGHSAGFTALVFVAVFAVVAHQQLSRRTSRRLVVLAGAASLIMAATRVLVGAHYPTDVIAGMLVGLVAADVAALLAREFNARSEVWRDRSVEA
jgi:membrane-associated phospholipid phosphatase